MTYVTDEVRTLIVAQTSRQRAWHPIEASEVRRFPITRSFPAERRFTNQDEALCAVLPSATFRR